MLRCYFYRLKFAQRAQRVRVDAHINESLDDRTLLRQYRVEIDRLRSELAVLREASKVLKRTCAVTFS